jgi:hypothetical protein
LIKEPFSVNDYDASFLNSGLQTSQTNYAASKQSLDIVKTELNRPVAITHCPTKIWNGNNLYSP